MSKAMNKMMTIRGSNKISPIVNIKAVGTRPSFQFEEIKQDDGSLAVGPACWTPIVLSVDKDDKQLILSLHKDATIDMADEQWMLSGCFWIDLNPDEPFVLLRYNKCHRKQRPMIESFILQLTTMEPSERVKAFVRIFDVFCRDCGESHPTGRICQCDNDT